MKNIEKYPNTNDALAAYNALDLKKVPFGVWLKCKFEEPRVTTLLEAAQEVVKTWYAKIPEGSLARVGQSIVRLSTAIEREMSKPVRNCDVLSKDEVLEMLKDRSFSKEDTIEWLYGKAEKVMTAADAAIAKAGGAK